MPRTKTSFCCASCGHAAPRRLGCCPSCGEWNTFHEEGPPAAAWTSARLPPTAIPDLPATAEERFPSGSSELDRVLGGGFVRGSTTLLGGDPGVGKSTLLLQTAHRVAAAGLRVLYFSAEESAAQIRLRAGRLAASSPRLLVACATSLGDLAQDIASARPDLVVVDSIQTVAAPEIPSIPGSVTQVRECAVRLNGAAKAAGYALVLVGHVTKDGTVAGPRTLEHLVDAVLYVEGDHLQNYRLVRAVKNRFGATGEIGIFEMTASGLSEVANPSRYFSSRTPSPVPGCVVTPALVGSRTLLVDVQALTSSASYGTPTRRVSGVDPNRLAVILAVLENRAGLRLGGEDVFVAAAGGARLEEPAADLSIALAVASAFRGRPFPGDTAVIGEIGLGGEIRPCGPVEARIEEAARLGFKRVLVPAPQPRKSGCEVVAVHEIQRALEVLA